MKLTLDEREKVDKMLGDIAKRVGDIREKQYTIKDYDPNSDWKEINKIHDKLNGIIHFRKKRFLLRAYLGSLDGKLIYDRDVEAEKIDLDNPAIDLDGRTYSIREKEVYDDFIRLVVT